MKTSLFALALVAGLAGGALSSTVQAAPVADVPAGTYVLDKTHASLTWKVSHLGLSKYTARFIAFDAKLEFDPNAVEAAKLTAEIDPTSIRTDYPFADKKNFDNILATESTWFNAPKFPKITFTSTKVERTGEKTGKVTGDLSLLGVSKPVTLDVTFNGGMKEQPFAKKPALGFSAKGTIKRSDWGMGYLVPNVGDEVELLLEVEFLGQ